MSVLRGAFVESSACVLSRLSAVTLWVAVVKVWRGVVRSASRLSVYIRL